MDDLQHLLDQLGPDPDKKPDKKPEHIDYEDKTDPGNLWVDGIIDQSELMIGSDADADTTSQDGDILAFPSSDNASNDIAGIGADSTTALVSLTDTPPASPVIDLNKYLVRLDGVTDEILDACRSDRQEAQEVINMFRREIEGAANKNQVPRMYVDGLVKAVEVKANINMTAVKMMEANAKMLASTKATTNIQVNSQNVNVASNDQDLERILDEPMTPDDEY